MERRKIHMKTSLSDLKKVFAGMLAAVVTSGGLLTGLAGNALAYNYVTPRLIVTGSEIKSESVTAGDDFDMTIHLKNESTTTPLNNVRLEFVSDDNQIIPSAGTNVTYIDSIEKEAEIDVVVGLKTRGDLQQKIYSLAVNMEYEDRDRKSYEASSQVTVPVTQIPEMSVTDLKLSRKEVFLNGKTNISFALNNTGKDMVYNVAVELTGDQIDKATSYVGNVAVGESKSVDLSILASKLGEGDVKAKIVFEDADGKKYSTDESITFKVIEAPQEVAVEQDAGIDLRIVGAAAAGVVVLIIIVTVVRKKKERAYA